MAGITRLYGNFGDDPNKWAKAIRRGTTTSMRSGKLGLAIETKEKFLTQVSLDQLQKVANEFEKKGSLEVKEALDDLAKKLNRSSDDAPEPVPLVRVKKMNNIQVSRFSSTLKYDLIKNPEKALWALLQDIFPKEEKKDLEEIKQYPLADKILCVAKGSFRLSQLQAGVNVLNRLLEGKNIPKKEKKDVEAAMSELTYRLNYQKGERLKT